MNVFREVEANQADSGLPLRRRESEVVGLLAAGLTKREIGSRLFISVRTAEAHVEQILNKLGFNRRSQVAAWVASGALSGSR